jgi:hypothetical protein
MATKEAKLFAELSEAHANGWSAVCSFLSTRLLFEPFETIRVIFDHEAFRDSVYGNVPLPQDVMEALFFRIDSSDGLEAARFLALTSLIVHPTKEQLLRPSGVTAGPNNACSNAELFESMGPKFWLMLSSATPELRAQAALALAWQRQVSLEEVKSLALIRSREKSAVPLAALLITELNWTIRCPNAGTENLALLAECEPLLHHSDPLVRITAALVLAQKSQPCDQFIVDAFVTGLKERSSLPREWEWSTPEGQTWTTGEMALVGLRFAHMPLDPAVVFRLLEESTELSAASSVVHVDYTELVEALLNCTLGSKDEELSGPLIFMQDGVAPVVLDGLREASAKSKPSNDTLFRKYGLESAAEVEAVLGRRGKRWCRIGISSKCIARWSHFAGIWYLVAHDLMEVGDAKDLLLANFATLDILQLTTDGSAYADQLRFEPADMTVRVDELWEAVVQQLVSKHTDIPTAVRQLGCTEASSHYLLRALFLWYQGEGNILPPEFDTALVNTLKRLSRTPKSDEVALSLPAARREEVILRVDRWDCFELGLTPRVIDRVLTKAQNGMDADQALALLARGSNDTLRYLETLSCENEDACLVVELAMDALRRKLP